MQKFLFFPLKSINIAFQSLFAIVGCLALPVNVKFSYSLSIGAAFYRSLELVDLLI